MRRSCSVVTTLIFLFIVIVVIFFISCDFSLLHSLFIFGLHILFNVCTANNNIIIVCYFNDFQLCACACNNHASNRVLDRALRNVI